MADQFGVSTDQRKVIDLRARRRAALRAEFLKLASDPARHASGEGGTVFDPALQRFMAMRVSTYEHWRPTAKNLAIVLATVFIPMFTYGYFLKTTRENREAVLRRGEVPYSKRGFKFQ